MDERSDSTDSHGGTMSRYLVLLPLAAVLSTSGLSAQLQTKEPERLFRSREILDLTLIAPLKSLFKNRDTAEKVPQSGQLVVPSDAGVDTVPVTLETRGHFRLKSSTCSFPPIKVIFDKSTLKETIFKGQGSLKLSTHCKDSDRYEQNVLVEEAIYRIYNLLSPLSHLTRLVRMSYVNTEDPKKELVRMAFFIEDDDEMAKRNGAIEMKVPALTLGEMDPPQLDLMSVFLYMIANHDWSIYALHNTRVLQVDGYAFMYPVAYDFDFSGLVNAPYAGPPPQLTQLKRLRDRLYRGPCRTVEEITPTLEFFTAKKDSILAIINNQPGLEPGRIKDAVNYLDDFFDKIEKPQYFDRELDYACRH